MASEQDQDEILADVHAILTEDSEHENKPQDTTDQEAPSEKPRRRQMTARGMEHQRGLKEKRLYSISRGLEKNQGQIEATLAENEEDKGLYKLTRTWLSLYDDFLKIDEDYRELLTHDEKETHDAK